MFYSQDGFLVLAKDLIHGISGFENQHVHNVFRRRFGQHFGTRIENLPILWDYCINNEESRFNQLKKERRNICYGVFIT